MNGICKKVQAASDFLRDRNHEEAMLQLAIAIDTLAKKKYSKKLGVGARFRRFVDFHEDFLICMALGGKSQLVVTGDLRFGERGTLSEILYKFVRNPLVHDGDSSSDIYFSEEKKFGHHGSKFIVRHSLLWGLLFVIVGDPLNRNLKIENDKAITIDRSEVSLNSLWGRLEKIYDLLDYTPPPKWVKNGDRTST